MQDTDHTASGRGDCLAASWGGPLSFALLARRRVPLFVTGPSTPRPVPRPPGLFGGSAPTEPVGVAPPLAPSVIDLTAGAAPPAGLAPRPSVLVRTLSGHARQSAASAWTATTAG